MIDFHSGPSINSYKRISNWFNLEKDKILKVNSGKVDIGQHISSTLALICSKITGVPYDQIEIVRLNTDFTPDEGKTASSLSVPHSGSALKAASLTLRKNFFKYVIENLDIQKENLIFENGIIKDKISNKSFSYWDFFKTKEFSNLEIPETFTEKELNSFSYDNNQKVEIKSINEIITGKYKYVHDMTFPNMLHARIIRPPNYYSKFLKIDDKILNKLKQLDIKLIIKGSFISILSKDEFLVVKYLNILKNAIEWKNIKNLSNKSLQNMLLKNDRETLNVRPGGEAFYEKVPELKTSDNNGNTTLTSEFQKSYLMHGPIGPSAACAIFSNDSLTVYSHSQALYDLKVILPHALNLKEENVKLIFSPGSGCYGHNGADDAAFEVSVLAKDLPNNHILLKWTREDEHCWEPYGSASINKLTGTINNEGRITYWSNEVYSDTYLTRPTEKDLNNFVSYKLINDDFSKNRYKPKTVAHMGIHRNLDPLYEFEDKRLVKNLVHDLPLRTSALRTLGAFANVTATESFLDELAVSKDIDPFDIRINHLRDNRAKDVLLDLKTQMLNESCPEGNARGIGFSRYKNSAAYCAVGIELNITDELEIILKKAWISVDAGEIAYEDGIKAQVEGGLIQAASWCIYEEVKFDNYEIISKDWDSYNIIGFDNIPTIKSNVIDRKGYPYLGVGEVVAGPTGGALSNAIYRSLGERLKIMPYTKENIKKQLLQ